MGDGPGHDARDRQIDADVAEKRRRQRRRIGLLEDMMRDVGLGDHDPARGRLDAMAAESLQRAYDLLCLLTRR